MISIRIKIVISYQLKHPKNHLHNTLKLPLLEFYKSLYIILLGLVKQKILT